MSRAIDVNNTATSHGSLIRSKQQDGSDATVISGSSGLLPSERDYYIMIFIRCRLLFITRRPGDPNVAELLTLNDLYRLGWRCG